MPDPAACAVKIRIRSLAFASLATYRVQIDGQETGRLSPGAERIFPLEPGRHILRVMTYRGGRSERAEATLAPGMSRAFDCGIKKTLLAELLLIFALIFSLRFIVGPRGEISGPVPIALLGAGLVVFVAAFIQSFEPLYLRERPQSPAEVLADLQKIAAAAGRPVTPSDDRRRVGATVAALIAAMTTVNAVTKLLSGKLNHESSLVVAFVLSVVAYSAVMRLFLPPDDSGS